MANFNLVTNSTTARNMASNETGLIGQNATLTLFTGSAIFDSGAPANNVAIVNNGSIYGDTSAVWLDGFGTTITNRGQISARSNVVNLTGVTASDDGLATILNYGVISGVNNAADAIVAAGGGHYIFNAGSIFGKNDDAIDLGGSASSQKNTIINTGEIASSTTSSLSGAIKTHDARDHITNSGTIGGNILTEAGNDKLINKGHIEGDVSLGKGSDLFDGRGGTVDGVVRGGTGNDRYYVDDGKVTLREKLGEGTDEVHSSANHALGDHFETLTLLGSKDLNGHGNDAANTLTGNDGDNTLRGKGGWDTLNGAGGDDKLLGQDGRDQLNGGTGNDVLRGGSGIDTLRGEAGDDTLHGGADNDILSGGRNDDKLFGNSGTDRLSGDAGNDVMKGGLDHDTFLFSDGFGIDTISDFDARSNGEKISLAGVSSITSWVDLRDNHLSQKGADVLIDAGDGNTILLKNVLVSDLGAGDFLF